MSILILSLFGIAILWKRVTKEGAIAGVVVGVVFLIIGFIFKNFNAVILAFLINTLVYILVSLLTPNPSEQIERIYFDEVDDFLTGRN